MELKDLNWEFEHSKKNDHFNVIGKNIGGKYKIAVVPYLSLPDLPLATEVNKKEAEQHVKLMAFAPEMLKHLIFLIEMIEREDVVVKDNVDNDGNESIFGKLFAEITSTVKKVIT